MNHFTFPGKNKAEALHRCGRCRGTGRADCQFCAGKGTTVQGQDIFGNPKSANCSACFGLKTTRCAACAGQGFLL
jgi:DnaJ-class molecular chaperone